MSMKANNKKWMKLAKALRKMLRMQKSEQSTDFKVLDAITPSGSRGTFDMNSLPKTAVIQLNPWLAQFGQKGIEAGLTMRAYKLHVEGKKDADGILYDIAFMLYQFPISQGALNNVEVAYFPVPIGEAEIYLAATKKRLASGKDAYIVSLIEELRNLHS